jgi:perosamine synthetase
MNPVPEGDVAYGYWMPSIVFSEASIRNAVLEAFQKNNVDGRVFFHPLSSMSMFSRQSTNVFSYSIASRALNLPSYNDMTANDLGRAIDIVKKMAGIK